ncbi:MAG: ATP-binding cassette domain-containing protein, partial [Acidobacteriota bacterium]
RPWMESSLTPGGSCATIRPMALLSLRDVHLSYGDPPLLDDVTLHVEAGEQIAIIGRNGAGKTTFLKILQGEIEPDDGEIVRAQGASTAFLRQEVPRQLAGETTFDCVAGGVAADGHDGEWQIEQQVGKVLSQMDLDPGATVGNLSAGLKRRVLLARALVADPDILLLDEPTNHLDIASIRWLESFLLRQQRSATAEKRRTLIFVTHDRALLRQLASRIIELDRGHLADWSCDYETFLQRRQALLDAEEGQRVEFDKKLAREEAWIRQGIKARRTRNEGRVRALEKMRQLRRARRQRTGNVRFSVQQSEASGKVVIETQGASFGYGDDGVPVVRELTTRILRGDKVGLIGDNGSGKTTLLRLLLGELPPSAGSVRHGTRLEIAYFDQLRAQLDEERTVLDNIADGNDRLVLHGKPRHALGYLQDFLFTPDRARSPVAQLSGGERNRLLLARLFAQPSNVLVLDEPTNDLDLETLDLLEQLLIEYPGTLLVVSHDREFLDQVVTSTLVLEGRGKVGEYVGGYSDWLQQSRAADRAPSAGKKSNAKKASAKPKADRPRKLSYKEKLELEALPGRIESLENEQSELHTAMAAPDFYQRGGEAIANAKTRLSELEGELEVVYERWAVLEEIGA